MPARSGGIGAPARSSGFVAAFSRCFLFRAEAFGTHTAGRIRRNRQRRKFGAPAIPFRVAGHRASAVRAARLHNDIVSHKRACANRVTKAGSRRSVLFFPPFTFFFVLPGSSFFPPSTADSGRGSQPFEKGVGCEWHAESGVET